MEKEPVKKTKHFLSRKMAPSFVPLSENTAITAIISLLVLPLCVWQGRGFVHFSQKGCLDPIIIRWFDLFLFLFFYCCFSISFVIQPKTTLLVVLKSLLSSSQRRLCLLFLHLFCHPAKDDFACKSFLSSS